MITDKELSDYYDTLRPLYDKALADVRWLLDQFLSKPEGVAASEGSGDQEEIASPEEIAKIGTSSDVVQRVKPFDSVLRKSLRTGVSNVVDIPDKVEDLLGIRIATVNKDQARRLFEYLRRYAKQSWFCKSAGETKFVPYTIMDKNNYSLRTGYQAYHVTFIYEQSYTPRSDVTRWPVEIQIMAQMWRFWADYSRKYFYGGSDSSQQLLPYNVIISKILDSADDLMLATTDFLLPVGREREKEPTSRVATVEEEIERAGGITSSDLRAWFDKNAAKYFGNRARTPIDLFLYKIADELNLYGISLERLEKILQDKEINSQYDAILRASDVPFLYPYQKILCMILLSLSWEITRVVERVNGELWLLGIRLKPPQI